MNETKMKRNGDKMKYILEDGRCEFVVLKLIIFN